MADIPARTELTVTTGPIHGSRKIWVEKNGVRVALRRTEPAPSQSVDRFAYSIDTIPGGFQILGVVVAVLIG